MTTKSKEHKEETHEKHDHTKAPARKETLKHKDAQDEADQGYKALDELTSMLQHVQADFENYKKRVEREKAEFAKYANQHLLCELLPIIDNLERALAHKDQAEQFGTGVEMIHQELLHLLRHHHVTPIGCAGEKFDPYRHQALMQEASDAAPGTVIEVYEKGYTCAERVLRHARVKIAKAKEAPAPTANTADKKG